MKELDTKKLKDLLTKLRISRELSREDMGELLGVSGKTIRRWENGESLPSMADVVHICNEFNISLEEVYEGQVNIDREVDRKLSKVDVGLKTINSGISEIKDQFERLYSGSDDNYNVREHNLSWLWLFVIHIIATAIGFLCHGMARIGYYKSFASSIIYMIMIYYFIHRNRHNSKTMKMIILYAAILIVNILLNYVIFVDVTPGIISNVELLAVNGAIYGIIILMEQNMSLFLVICLLVYSSWLIICAYQLIKSNK